MQRLCMMWTGLHPGLALRMAGITLDPKGTGLISLEFANTLMGILFVVIWLLVGHILTTEHR